MVALYGEPLKLIDTNKEQDIFVKTYLDRSAVNLSKKNISTIKIVDKPVIRDGSVIKVVNEIKVSRELSQIIKREPIVISKEAYKDLVLHAMDRAYIRYVYGRKTESDFLLVINFEKRKNVKHYNNKSFEKVGISTFKKGKSTIVIVVDLEQNRVIGLSYLYRDSMNGLNRFYKLLSSMSQEGENGSPGFLKKSTFIIDENPLIKQIISEALIDNSRIIIDNDNPAIHIAHFLESVCKNQKIEVIKDALVIWKFKITKKRHKTVVEVVPATSYGL